jgi:hypothetical protein
VEVARWDMSLKYKVCVLSYSHFILRYYHVPSGSMLLEMQLALIFGIIQLQVSIYTLAWNLLVDTTWKYYLRWPMEAV